MDLSIFNLPDSSGRMYKESFMIKNHKEEYDYIIDYCDNNNLLDISFKEKAYLALNKLNNIPVCKNINCKNRVNFKNSTISITSILASS